jgi:hypothetical protein
MKQESSDEKDLEAIDYRYDMNHAAKLNFTHKLFKVHFLEVG